MVRGHPGPQGSGAFLSYIVRAPCGGGYAFVSGDGTSAPGVRCSVPDCVPGTFRRILFRVPRSGGAMPLSRECVASAPGCGPGAGMLSSPNCAAYCALIHSYTGSMPFVKSAKLISILTSGVIVLASSSVRRKYLVE